MTLHMNMEWFVLLAIKEERESIKSKYFWHIVAICYDGVSDANIGIIFDTIVLFMVFVSLP